jgi:hypothetical protein
MPPRPRPLRHDPTLPNRTALPNFADCYIFATEGVSGQAGQLGRHVQAGEIEKTSGRARP